MKQRIKTAIIISSVALLLGGCATEKATYSSNHHVVHRNHTAAAKANVVLATEFMKKNDNVKAKEKLLLAQKQAPKLPAVWYGMGYFLEHTGDLAAAETQYKHAISLAPKDGEAHNNYGTFLCRHGKYNESLQEFMLAVKDPNYLQVTDAYENAGMCALKIPDQKRAYAYFNKALDYNSNADVALYYLSQIQYDNGQYAHARTNLRHLIELEPPIAETLWLYARVELKLGHQAEYQQAMALLKEKHPEFRTAQS